MGKHPNTSHICIIRSHHQFISILLSTLYDRRNFINSGERVESVFHWGQENPFRQLPRIIKFLNQANSEPSRQWNELYFYRCRWWQQWYLCGKGLCKLEGTCIGWRDRQKWSQYQEGRNEKIRKGRTDLNVNIVFKLSFYSDFDFGFKNCIKFSTHFYWKTYNNFFSWWPHCRWMAGSFCALVHLWAFLVSGFNNNQSFLDIFIRARDQSC